ncbi:MAG: iron uptake porin [Cyanobacteriota bacterium]|nr:iron uptake porin [Cyanobacteriota bacterium]
MLTQRARLAALLALMGLFQPLSVGAMEQVTTITQFSDVKPTDWAYQALSSLVERYGCVAGYPQGSFGGNREISRFEAAALLNACLDRVSETTDELRRLLKEFENELASLRGRSDGLSKRIGTQEAQQFSATTKLSGSATFVIGGSAFSGTASALVDQAQAVFGATTFNYDLQLNFDTSFNGRDLLRTTLRGGNFDVIANSFGGGGPSSLSQLEVAFQQEDGSDIVGIDRLYYQLPLGEFTVTVGGRVGQDDMLALWPSVYPDSTVLDALTLNGAPLAYNKNLGAGAGLWWKTKGWSVSASYVAANAANSAATAGGIGTEASASSATLQLGYQQEQWGAAFLYSAVQNGAATYGTNALMNALNTNTGPNLTQAFALSAYWQPARAGWIPSISAGWGLNSTSYSQPQPAGTPTLSQSWSVGLQWLDAFATGNAAGMGFGQAPMVTAQSGNIPANDSNWMWEWWYKFQISDGISITPALFYLVRPLGQDTPAGLSFNQLGVLVKTSFQF